MQFPLETVREVAQILSESGLGEISLETTGSGPVTRLALKRPVVSVAAAPEEVAEVDEFDGLAEGFTTPLDTTPTGPEPIVVTSNAVGVFRAAKPALAAGDEVKRKQLVAIVESLKIPNEIYAAGPARVVEVLVADGQGVEWGQPLLILEALEA